MRALLAIASALSDRNRIRILCALAGGELCVCQIQEMLGLAHSTTSKHLSLLASAGLVDARREGRWAYYRLAEDEPLSGAGEVVTWFCQRAEESKGSDDDRRRLRAILKISPEELCRMQAEGIECCSCAPATPAAARSPKGGRAPSGRKR